MRRFALLFCAVCLLAMLLGACDSVDHQQTGSDAPPVTDPVEDAPQTQPDPTDEPDQSTTQDPESEDQSDPAQDAGTVSLRAAVSIFSGPSYDESYLQPVGEDGVYTITEQTKDAEGNLWGKLKSGAGWVSLTEAAELDKLPLTASYAGQALLQSGNYIDYCAEETDSTVQIAFYAYDQLHDVRLTGLDYGDAGYVEGQTLYTLASLTPDKPLVAGVVFPGDLTAYGLCFTGSDGTAYHYAVTISGRNGTLVMEPYQPE